jgi:hypothetical protein
MPDTVIIALVLSSGSLVVSIASFVPAISAKRQAKKAATLGFRVEAINHLRTVLSDLDRGSITSRTVDTIHDAKRSTELVFSRDVRETPLAISWITAVGSAQEWPLVRIMRLIDDSREVLFFLV